MLLNLDETRVSRRPGKGRGNIMVSSRTYKRQCRPRPIQRATRAQLRGGVTHVAFVADRPEVQAVLPQVIIHNKHMPTLRTRRAIAAEVPDNGVIVRQTSSWTNTDNMVDLLRRLGLALTPWTRALQPFFLGIARSSTFTRASWLRQIGQVCGSSISLLR